MLTSGPFDSRARVIWAQKSEMRQWWLARKAFVVKAGFDEASLKITSGGHHAVFVNGHFVTRGPARAYSFAHCFDTVPISRFLRPGTNSLVVCALQLDEAGLLAQVDVGAKALLWTDGTWKMTLHPCFDLSTAIVAVPLDPRWREERYDARLEQPWDETDFDDSLWETARELCEPTDPAYGSLFPNLGGLLSDDVRRPKSILAQEWCKPKPGHYFRFDGEPIPTAQKVSRANVYLTEILSPKAVEVEFCLGGAEDFFVNGKRAAGVMTLKAGRNLVVCTRLYGPVELLVEAQDGLTFDCRSLRADLATPWYGLVVALAQTYPFHDPAARVFETIFDDLPRGLSAQFEPLENLPPSTAFLAANQDYYHGTGCYRHPDIARGQAAEPTSWPSTPVVDSRYLLHGNAAHALCLPQSGYDLHLVLDFGSECLGHLSFTLEAGEGTVVDVCGFEKIDGKGISWMPMNALRFVCKQGWQTHTSLYSRGFRYLSVTLRHMTAAVRLASVSVVESVYAGQQVGSFLCSDPQLNQIFDMSLETARLCLRDSYIDCPGYEQVFWAGDARIPGLVSLLHLGGYDFDQHNLNVVGLSLSSDYARAYHPDDVRYQQGRMLTMVSRGDYCEGGLPLWSFQWVVHCFEHALLTGDRASLVVNFAAIRQLLENCGRLTNSRGLFDMPGAWNLIEWANNDLSPYGEVTASSAWLARCYTVAAQMAEWLGERDLQTDYLSRASGLKHAINQFCWDETRQGYVDTVRDEFGYSGYLDFCRGKDMPSMSYERYLSAARISEQTQTLVYLCDCVPSARLEPVQALIRRAGDGRPVSARFVAGAPSQRTFGPPPEKEAPDGIVAVGSPYFLFFSLEALFRMGEAKTALKVVRDAWGAMLDHGTTTCWETLFQDEANWTRSVCHGWSAAPAVHFATEVLGIRALEPGFRTFTVKPQLGGLAWAKGSVATPYGPLYVDCRDGNVEVHAPRECVRVLEEAP